MKATGVLYVVATPIGHLDDISQRALATLREVDVIAAEDTRHTSRLLSHYGIVTRVVALHAHNEDQAAAGLLRWLQEGKDLALVSDAGTPLVSDPGSRLLSHLRAADVRIVPLPGPSAVLAALVCAGFSADRFVFEGFMPRKGGGRIERLRGLSRELRTSVIFESPKRIGLTLSELAQLPGFEARQCCLCRELTKMHESSYVGTAAELAQGVASGDIPTRGEFVLVIAGAAPEAASQTDLEEALDALGAELAPAVAARVAARLTGLPRQAIYRRIAERAERSESSS